MALLSALLATVLLMGLGVSLVLLGTSEAVLAAHDRTVRALRDASMAAVFLAAADLRRQPAWSSVLAPGSTPLSAAPGRATDASVTPPAPWGGLPLDLRQLTLDVAGSAATGAGDPQLWRLYESGTLADLIPAGTDRPIYLAVWVADDPADGDGDPLVDRNGILAVRAAAFGPANAKAEIAVSVQKLTLLHGPAQVRILTIRPLP